MLDASLFIKLGAIVAGCVTVPLITSLTGGGTNNTKTKSLIPVFHENGDRIGPIFSCSNGTDYKVYLVPSDGKWTKKDEKGINIDLQIVEEAESGKERVVWGPNFVERSEKKWNKWEIDVVSNRTIALYPQRPQTSNDGFGVTAFCLKDNKAFSWIDSNGLSQKFIQVEGGNVNKKPEFKLENCRNEGEGEICDIKFDNIFSWEEGFNPKITFSTKQG